MKKKLLILLGFFFVGLGIVGIFLPLFPTTPFLLLAAALFARSSPRFYRWLLNNRWLGSYMKNYRGETFPLKQRYFLLPFLDSHSLFMFFRFKIMELEASFVPHSLRRNRSSACSKKANLDAVSGIKLQLSPITCFVLIT